MERRPCAHQSGALTNAPGREKEYDLGFKIDSGVQGPDAATPALVPTGRVGDRAFVIFAGLDQLTGGVKKGC